MAIQETKCPHCQNAISVQSEWLGMNLQCPSCQNNFIYTEEQPAAAPEVAPVITPVPGVAPAVTPVPGVAPAVTPVPGVAPAVTPAVDAAAEKLPKAGMFTALARYANFTGRANRREYWLFVLFQTLLFSALYIASVTSTTFLDTTIIATICSAISGIAALAFFIPNLAVLIRRFHDRNHSWTWIFIYLVPCIGPLLLLITLCGGSVADNKWGKNPNGGKSGEAWPCVLALLMNIILGGVVTAVTFLCAATLVAQAFKGTLLEDFIKDSSEARIIMKNAAAK